MKSLRVLTQKYIRPLGGMLVLCLAVGMLGQIAMLLQPKYAETLIRASQSKADLTVPLAALVALLAGAALSAMIQQMLLAKMSEGMAEDIRSQLARSFFLSACIDPGIALSRLVFSAHLE